MKLPSFVKDFFGVLDEDVKMARSSYRPANCVESRVYGKVAGCGSQITSPDRLWPFYKLHRDLGYNRDCGYDNCTSQTELMFGLEDEFDMIIPEKDVEKWETVEDVYFYIRDRIMATGKEAAQEAGLIPKDSNTETFNLRDKT